MGIFVAFFNTVLIDEIEMLLPHALNNCLTYSLLLWAKSSNMQALDCVVQIQPKNDRSKHIIYYIRISTQLKTMSLTFNHLLTL